MFRVNHNIVKNLQDVPLLPPPPLDLCTTMSYQTRFGRNILWVELVSPPTPKQGRLEIMFSNIINTKTNECISTQNYGFKSYRNKKKLVVDFDLVELEN